MSGYEYTPWIWPSLGSAAFTAAVGLYVWRRRETPGALPLALVAFVASAWCLTNAAETAATDFASQRLWFIARDALGLPGAILALWFALVYAGFDRLMSRPLVTVLVGSVIVHAPLYLVGGGSVLWSRIWWGGNVRADLAPVGALFNVYGFGLFLLATVVLLVVFVRSPAHRMPVALILLGQIGLRAAYPLGALNLFHLPNVSLMVLAFDFAAAMYVIALFRFRMFDLVPIARGTIIERMPDAMLVLDLHDRVADLNRAAERLLDARRPDLLGRPVTAVLGHFPGLARLISASAPAEAEVALPSGAGNRWCQVGTSALADWHGAPIGRLVVLHDSTELKRAEEKLFEQERTVAVAVARERMARDLHDSVGQVLGYVSMQADAARKLLADGRATEAAGQLARLADIARDAHADVRGYIRDLHEPLSEQRPLFLDALRGELDGFARNYDVRIELTVHPALDAAALGPEEQTQLLRIVQEALSNARRHGDARQVWVGLEPQESMARLVIEDDGRGFDAAAVPPGNGRRHGMRFMRERVDELHGQLEVVSSPGHGTRLVVLVPLSAAGSTAAGPERTGGQVEAGTESR